jgi:asparaginyl-tRNA synthetase
MDIKFIDELVSETEHGDNCFITGRVSSVRRHSKFVFFDLVDNTGKIQIVMEKDKHPEDLSRVPVGSYVAVGGEYCSNMRRDPEINANSLEILASADMPLSPNPWRIDGTDPTHGKQVFGFPDFYIANPKRAAILKVKTDFVQNLHNYFQEHRFTLVEPPILTDKTLYDDETAVRASVHGEDVYLSQCATFELEPLAVVFRKVYTISPAFRNEKAGSKRHLAEYTHAKAEVLLADIEDLMFLAGDSLYHSLESTLRDSQKELELLGVDIDIEAIHPNKHKRMTYDEALRIVQSEGSSTKYGESLNRRDEEILTKHVGNSYLWVQFPPFEAEGFPYRRNPDKHHLSMTCDLIAPHGAGEMVGIAEKSTDPEELIQNLIEKGKGKNIRRYWRYIIQRRYGMPPHGGLGAAPERIIYGLLGLDHIRLTKPYPRYPDRRIVPLDNEPLNPWGDVELDRLIRKYKIR